MSTPLSHALQGNASTKPQRVVLERADRHQLAVQSLLRELQAAVDRACGKSRTVSENQCYEISASEHPVVHDLGAADIHLLSLSLDKEACDSRRFRVGQVLLAGTTLYFYFGPF